MDIDVLIEEAGSDNFLVKMQNASQDYAQYLLHGTELVTFGQQRYYCILASYAFAYAKYVEEIANSIRTIDHLSLNATARSAIECYALARFIFDHCDSDHNQLFQLIVSADLGEIAVIIEHYEKQIKSIPELATQAQNNRQIFQTELNIFAEKKQWLSQFSSEKQIVKVVRQKIKEDGFAPDVCENGKLVIGRLVEKMCRTNRHYRELFGREVDSVVLYDLMCSQAHNDYYTIMKLFSHEKGFRVSLYPQEEEQHNSRYIIRLLYACFVDLAYSLKEITEKIRHSKEYLSLNEASAGQNARRP